MTKTMLVLLLAGLLSACGTDNSSTVRFGLDAGECLVAADDFDWVSESATRGGLRTRVYVWECADYVNPSTDVNVEEKKVSLIFTGTACLQLTAELIEEGLCQHGKTPLQ